MRIPQLTIRNPQSAVRKLVWPRASLLHVASLVLPIWFAVLASHTIADADLWGHLRFGSDLLAGHGLPSVDPYSFTADTAWINHEWLSEAAVALTYALGGTLGLNLLKLAVIAAIGALTWAALVRADTSPLMRPPLTALVLFATYTRTQVLRPQLFSVLLFTLLVACLLRRERRESSGRIAIPMLFCVWANAHGAWIVGFAALAAWVCVETAERRTAAALRDGILALASSLAATLVNPYGTGHWTFLRETVGLSRADISDWVPFTRLPLPIIAIDLVLPLLAAISLIVLRRRPALRRIAVTGVLAFGTYRIGRVDAFLQIAVALLFAPDIVELLRRLERALERHPRLSTPYAIHGAISAAVVVAAIAVVAPRLRHVHIEGPWIPDPDAVHFLRDDAPHAKLLTWFDWGEYAIWHLSPSGVRVSMDGRRETVYSDRVLRDHWAFYRNEGDASSYPDRIGADHIWLPKDLPIVAALKDHGWHASFESGVSVVLSRQITSPRIVLAANRPHVFFPGP